MRRVLVLLLIVALLALPLALALHDLSRVLLTELLRLIRLVRLQIEAIPQPTIWGLLLVVVLVAAIGSLFGWSRRPLGEEAGRRRLPGHVRELSHWIRRASEGRYYRWTLNRYVSNLAWDIMSYQARTTPHQLKQRFRSGDVELPAAITTYFETSDTLPLPSSMGLRARLFPHFRPEGGLRDPRPELEAIVQYLEDQLEVEHDPGTG